MELEEGFITSPWKRINQVHPDGRLAYGKQMLPSDVIYYLHIYLSMAADHFRRDGIHLQIPRNQIH
jgi:hypothetical protein